MKVSQLVEILNATVVNQGDFERQIDRGYAGDLLSFVMGNAPSNCAWYTIMTNVNVCAVATLVDAAVVIICENSTPDENLIERAKTQNINVICTALNVFDAIATVAKHN